MIFCDHNHPNHPIFAFSVAFRIAMTGESRNYRFGTEVDLDKSRCTDDKSPSKTAWYGSRDRFLLAQLWTSKNDHGTSTVNECDKQPTVVGLLLTTPGDDSWRGRVLSWVNRRCIACWSHRASSFVNSTMGDCASRCRAGTSALDDTCYHSVVLSSSSSGTMGPAPVGVHYLSCNEFPSSAILEQTVQLL